MAALASILKKTNQQKSCYRYSFRTKSSYRVKTSLLDLIALFGSGDLWFLKWLPSWKSC